MQLSGIEPGCEVANDARLHISRHQARVGNRIATDFDDHILKRPPLLFQVSLKVGAGGADNIYVFHHRDVLQGPSSAPTTFKKPTRQEQGRVPLYSNMIWRSNSHGRSVHEVNRISVYKQRLR